MKITKTWLESEINKGTMESFSMKKMRLGFENGHEYLSDNLPTYTGANNSIHVTKDEDIKKLPEDVRVHLLTRIIEQEQTSDITTDYNILTRYLETKIKDEEKNFQTDKKREVESKTGIIQGFEKLLLIQQEDLRTEKKKTFTIGSTKKDLLIKIISTQTSLEVQKKELSHLNELKYTESEHIQTVKDIVRAYKELVGDSVPKHTYIQTGLSLQELLSEIHKVTPLLKKIMNSQEDYGVKIVVSDKYIKDMHLETSITIDGKTDWLTIPKYQLLIRFLFLQNKDETTINRILDSLHTNESVYQDEINAYKWALCRIHSNAPIDFFIKSMMKQVDANGGDTTAPPYW